MATLFVMQGKDLGKKFDLEGEVICIGRDGSNQIQIADGEVSRQHAQILRDEQGYLLVDLGSSNGTFVDTERIKEKRLKTGDRVLLGRSLLVFTESDGQSEDQLAHDVDIVAAARPEGSRILKSVSQEEGSQVFRVPDAADSPWLARARSNLQVMYSTALAVSHTLDINQLLSRILDLIFEWVQADRGLVMLVNQETGEVEPASSRNRKGVRGDARLTISRTILDFVMQRKEGVLTSDARDDQRWQPGLSIVTAGVREAICVPMQGRYGIVGVIYIDTYTPPGKVAVLPTPNRFTEEHLKLMVAIGHQAALAIEDTSYYSAMVQAERLAAMGQTIATLSHHIKNILQGIRGGSYLIDEGLKGEDNDMVRKGWRIVEKNQEKISNLVMDMLTFSKEREPDLVPTNLNDIVGDVVELMQTRAKDAVVALQWHSHDNLPQFTFDPDLMHRAILNVITNAIDASDHQEGTGRVEVHIEYAPGDQTVRIVVADNGEGIAPDDLKRIFSVFESRKGARGTGLGLPVSQKIMREHGGNVVVESTPGQGSKFMLELPARSLEDSSVARKLAEEEIPPPLPKLDAAT
ncbi:MAG TPA: ATP-binding protein [Pirellulaceae bacterium]|nr:ATP-binding protein [Pirellulaceae bacterium]